MAKDTEWQKPLEESLETILRSPDSTVKDLEEVRRALSMLCDGESVRSLYAQVDDVFRKREEAFRVASEQVRNGQTLDEVRKAMTSIQNLDIYEDKTEILRLGEERIAAFLEQERNEAKAKEMRLKKRNRILMIAAIACVFSVVLAGVLYSKHRTAKFNAMREHLQVLIDEGTNDEIVRQLAELEDYYKTDSDLYTLYETVLEKVATTHGFMTAFELLDILNLEDESVDLNNRLHFNDWSVGQIDSSSLSPEESWQIAVRALEQDRLKSTDEKVVRTFTKFLRTIVEAAEQDNSDSLSDIKTGIQKNQPYLVTVPVDPDLALQLCYSLEGKGMDLKELFPDGIRIDLPLGTSVSALNENLQSGGENESAVPDMSKLLPISVAESTSDANGSEIYHIGFRNEGALVSGIREIQREDTHYTIKLLPEYLTRIPEKMRAGSFEECTSVIAMQQLWVLSGCTSTYYIDPGPFPGLPGSQQRISNNDYRGYYMALDCVSVYDLSASDKFRVFEIEVHDAKCSEIRWYEMDQYGQELYTPEYRLGEHDLEWLKKNYEKIVDNLSMYGFLLSHSSLQQKLIEHIQEDDSESLTSDDGEEQIVRRQIFLQKKEEGDQQ